MSFYIEKERNSPEAREEALEKLSSLKDSLKENLYDRLRVYGELDVKQRDSLVKILLLPMKCGFSPYYYQTEGKFKGTLVKDGLFPVERSAVELKQVCEFETFNVFSESDLDSLCVFDMYPQEIENIRKWNGNFGSYLLEALEFKNGKFDIVRINGEEGREEERSYILTSLLIDKEDKIYDLVSELNRE